MTDILKGVGLVTLGVVVGLLLRGVAGESLGGVYSTVAPIVPSLTVEGVNSNATTTMNLGKVCMKITEADGGTVYWYAKADGNVGTTTSATCQS